MIFVLIFCALVFIGLMLAGLLSLNVISQIARMPPASRAKLALSALAAATAIWLMSGFGLLVEGDWVGYVIAGSLGVGVALVAARLVPR